MVELSLSKSDIDYLIRVTRDLVEIPSVNPPGEEGKVAEYISDRLSELGLQVDLYEVQNKRSNVVGLLRGKEQRPTLMLNGHMDVVPAGDAITWHYPPFKATVLADKIYGRGTVDMKGALAAMLTATRSVVNTGVRLRGNLLLTAVVDEEMRAMGTKSVLDRGYTADMAIVGEATELKVMIAHKGVIWVEVTTLGEAVHASTVRSSNPRVGINAIYKMAKVVSAFESYLAELEKRANPLVGNPTINVGTIVGGTKVNIVPDKCTIVLERRMVPGETVEATRSEIEEILRRIQSEDKDLRVKTDLILTHEPAAIAPEEKIVRLCRNAVKTVTSVDAPVTGVVYGTDMYLLVKRNIPTVILGPGSISRAHNADEFVEIEQLKDAAMIYARVILDALE